jgi:pimeloyl-ACP methyl ester carboxylesterase
MNVRLAPRRIVALALIAAVALGLGFLRFAPDSGRLAVPRGAQAGELTLEPCSYSTDGGAFPAECGTLVVPENRADTASRLIALPVTRIKSTSPTPGEPVFRLEGGPGKSNMEFPTANRLVGERDVVLVGYRGVDGSVRLDCPEVASAMKHAGDLIDADAQGAVTRAYADCAARLQREGVDLAGYTVPQRVDDLEAARVALGYDRINLVSESAGTRYALVYAWRYPQRVARSALIAANPPGHFFWDARTTDELLARYAALCAESEQCHDRTDDLAASMRRTAAEMPDRWLFLPIQPGNARLSSFFGLMESTSTPPLTAPMTLDSWHAAAHGDPSGLWFLSLMSGIAFPDAMVWGEYAAMGTQDADAVKAFYADGAGREGILGAPGTDFGWAGGGMADTWPRSPGHAEYAQMQRSEVETLVVSGNLDFATPPQVATAELMPFLPNGRQVVLTDLGHSGDFWTYQPDASRRLLETFFRDGGVDQSLYTHHTVDFTPGATHTMLAKILLGTMVGLAGAALLSLLLLALRMWWCGAFGTKASAVLRSVLPVVLGLGGWFFGVLVMLVVWPSVPVDDERLAVLAIGLPIGAGIALAWLNPSDRRAHRAGGVALAFGGALVGAWLGFHAVGGVLAVLTTIAGAAAAANLALIGLDCSSTRAKRSTDVGPRPVPADLVMVR